MIGLIYPIPGPKNFGYLTLKNVIIQRDKMVEHRSSARSSWQYPGSPKNQGQRCG